MTNKREDIRKEIQDEAPGLNDMGTSPVFNVPDGYFEEFPELLMNRIKAEEINDELTGFPRLSTIPRINPFSVPEGYFEGLPNTIGHKKFEEAPGRIVKMGRKVSLYKKCLIAAALAGVISVGAVLLSRQLSSNSMDKQLAQLSDQDMIDYLQYRTDDFDNENIFANASTEATEDSLGTIALPEGLTEEDMDALLEDNLLKDVPIN